MGVNRSLVGASLVFHIFGFLVGVCLASFRERAVSFVLAHLKGRGQANAAGTQA